MFFPNLAVFEVGAYIIFFFSFLHLGQEAYGGGEVVLMGVQRWECCC